MLKPPEKMTVSEWADRFRILPKGTSDQPGRWKTIRTPYLKGIMDAFTDTEVEEIVFVKPTQVGGTECILNIIAYIIDQDPSPTLLVYPSENLAEDICRNRIQPMIHAMNTLKSKYNERLSKLLALQFKEMYLPLVGANSAAGLASKPIRFLLMDEVDKYPPRSGGGKEADPISLARERTKRFSYNKKIFITSTPTLRTGAIWKEWESCTRQLYYYVPCPHCGEFQRLRLRQIKRGDDTIYYECAFCQAHLNNSDKIRMMEQGIWKEEKSDSNQKTSLKQKTGFSLNAIYSPSLTFDDVLKEWFASQNDMEKMQNFVNSWLGEPWEQVGSTAGEEKVLEKQSRYTRGVVPEDAVLLTAGVDVQRNGLYYVVRAWGYGKTSWNIDHGFIKGVDFNELLKLLDQTYYTEKGISYNIDFALVDSGDQTEEVYNFCYINQPLVLPVKGRSNNTGRPYHLSKVTKEDSAARGMQLVLCEGGFYKDMIYNRLNKEDGNWYVFDGIDPDYCAQITAEHKVYIRKGGVEKWVWQPKTSGIANHYLDCEVYAACAADIIGALDLLEENQNE